MKKKFLIVDDEIENRNFLTEILESWGHKVIEAQNGLEAITMLNVTFDLVLLDVNMPMMDGYEVVRRIRNEASVSDIPATIFPPGWRILQDGFKAPMRESGITGQRCSTCFIEVTNRSGFIPT